jgi:hypothetical protein
VTERPREFATRPMDAQQARDVTAAQEPFCGDDPPEVFQNELAFPTVKRSPTVATGELLIR